MVLIFQWHDILDDASQIYILKCNTVVSNFGDIFKIFILSNCLIRTRYTKTTNSIYNLCSYLHYTHIISEITKISP